MFVYVLMSCSVYVLMLLRSYVLMFWCSYVILFLVGSETDVESEWARSETEADSKWNRGQFQVESVRNRSEIDMISNWNRCETDVRSKWERSETEVSSKWIRSETPPPPHNLPYQSAGCGLAGWLAKANTNRGPIIGSAWYFYITCFDQMGKVRRHATALLGRSVPRYDCGAIAVTKIANLLHNIWYTTSRLLLLFYYYG